MNKKFKTTDEFKTARTAIEYYYDFEYGADEEAIKKQVNRVINNNFKKKDKSETLHWGDLTKLQRDKLIFIYLKDYLLKHITNSDKKKRIENDINQYRKDALIHVSEFIELNDTMIELIWNGFENLNGKDKETIDQLYEDYVDKVNTFNEFNEKYSKYNHKIDVLDKEDWINWNMRNDGRQTRIYDQIMSKQSKKQEEFYNNEDNPYYREPDKIEYLNVVILTIVKVLKEKKIADIDLNLIHETLEFLYNCGYEDFDYFLQPQSKISELSDEEREKNEEYVKKYLEYKKKFDNLDFYKSYDKNTKYENI